MRFYINIFIYIYIYMDGDMTLLHDIITIDSPVFPFFFLMIDHIGGLRIYYLRLL